MTGAGKDASEVVKFMTLFARLKDWCDDAPDELVELAATDASVRDLCNRVYAVANDLRQAEHSIPALFMAPVTPGFLEVWRDYERRYELALSNIEPWDSEGRFIVVPPGFMDSNQKWLAADVTGASYATAMQGMVLVARILAETENPILARVFDSEPGDDGPTIEIAIEAWEVLTDKIGLDPRGAFQRRLLVPLVLVPRDVATKHGSAETLPMLKSLQQAHDAFVYGATYAALALMRSIMEAVLRDYYRAEGTDLSERIHNARGRLPHGANEAALHRLRKLANAILHLDLDREKDVGLPGMDDAQLEKEIVRHLFVLRALIEGVK